MFSKWCMVDVVQIGARRFADAEAEILDYCMTFLYEAWRSYYLTRTPEEFTRRNIFCGDRMFANKWEALDDYLERKRKTLAG